MLNENTDNLSSKNKILKDKIEEPGTIKKNLWLLFKDRWEEQGIEVPDIKSAKIIDKAIEALDEEEVNELADDLRQGKGFLRILFENPAEKVGLYPENIFAKTLELTVDFNDLDNIKKQIDPCIAPKRCYGNFILHDQNTGDTIEITGDIRNTNHIYEVIKESQKLFDLNTKKAKATFIKPLFSDINIEIARCLPFDDNHTHKAQISVSIADVFEKPNPSSVLSDQVYLAETVNILGESGNYVRIKTPSGFEGYTSRQNLISISEPAEKSGEYFIIKEKSADIKLESGEIIKAPFSSQFKIVDKSISEYKVILPDGQYGFISNISGDVRNYDSVLNPSGKDIAELAKIFIGTPYEFWSYTPESHNCSVMVYLVYKYFDIKLPLDADLPFLLGKPVELDDLHPGDVLFFGDKAPIEDGSFLPSHVGIYIGNGNFIHNTPILDGTSITSINSPYYSQLLLGARRFIYPGAPKDFLKTLSDKVIGFKDAVIILKKM